jgi:hypothetical protein
VERVLTLAGVAERLAIADPPEALPPTADRGRG